MIHDEHWNKTTVMLLWWDMRDNKMNFTWNRFDKMMPPEDTTIMVSNGPAMGYYHFKTEQFMNPEHQVTKILLWELNGTRHEVMVSEITQWSKILVSDVKRTPLVKLTRWQKFKNWLKGML
jgi:hypothetical protein